MKYRVVLKSESGEERRIMEASSRHQLYALVGNEGKTVVSVADAGFALPRWLTLELFSGASASEIVFMAKNMSTMLGAGLSLARALSVAERQARSQSFKAVILDLEQSVREGGSFHDALAKHPETFSDLLIAMTRAGEESGSLGTALGLVGTQLERALDLKKKIRGAMIYPAFVVFAVLVVGILMMIYVVPTLTKTFDALHSTLPFSTRLILGVSSFLTQNFVAVISALILVTILAYLGLRSRAGKDLIVRALLPVPAIGEIVRETYVARTARTLSSLIASGVPVLEALEITKEVVQTDAFARVIDEAGARVKKGEPMSAAFAAHAYLYPPLFADMTAVGEETGKSAEMLGQVAQFFENDVEDRSRDLSSVVEPVLILLIGFAVGVFAVSMIAPIYSITAAF